MNAKNTVIEVKDHSEGICCPWCGEEFGIKDRVGNDRELQAEASFAVGIKEVVGTTLKIAAMGGEVQIKELFMLHPEGQAQLEEWGIPIIKEG